MRGLWRLVFGLAIVLPLALGLTDCGDGDSTDSTSAATAGAGPAATGITSGEDPDPSPSTEKGSAGFRTPGGDNSIQNYGEEADAAEVAAASAVLTAYLEARAKDDWAGECGYLARTAVAPLEQLASSSPRLKGKGCPEILAALMAGTPAAGRQNTLNGPIAGLRREGERAFALYHGVGGADYYIQMVKEDGEWKVGALAPSEFP